MSPYSNKTNDYVDLNEKKNPVIQANRMAMKTKRRMNDD